MAPCLASSALVLPHSSLLTSLPFSRRAGKSKAPSLVHPIQVSPFLRRPSFYEYNPSLHRGFRAGHLLICAHLHHHNNGCSHDHGDEGDHHHDEDHTHSHEDHIAHHHQKAGRPHGGHAHSHCHAGGGDSNHNAVQRIILIVASALGLMRLADALRDNFRLCCLSMAMLLVAAACPYVLQPQLGFSVQSGLAFSAFPLVGVPAILDAAVDIAGLKVNIHVLMALAAFASLVMGNALEGGLLLAMFSFSHIAEEYFTERALGDVKALKESNPESALVLETSGASAFPSTSAMTYTEVPLHKVVVGSFILVRAGEAVPVDGEVWQGRSMVTVEHLTGEAEPIEKKVGDLVPGGARNLDGMLIIKGTKTWEDSTLARIMKLTEEAQQNRPKLQRWLDDFGERYSQAVIAMSVSVALLGPLIFKWPLIGNSVSRGSIYRALGLMVAASPCALAAAPLAYAAAVSSCASKGILLKGGQALDALASCDTVAFDKTGTLTTGDLICKAIEPIYGHVVSRVWEEPELEICCNPNCETEALAIAAAMEQGASHPIARAVVDHSEGKVLPTLAIENFESIPGRGLEATISGLKSQHGGKHKALLGSLDYVASSMKLVSSSGKIIDAAKGSAYGNELVRAALSVNEKVTLFHFEDKLRPGALEVVASLKKAGMRILMLTGDHASSAHRVAKSVGIEEVHFGMKPEDKLNCIKRLSRQSGKGLSRGLIMVGDGVNDAPALAAATVGVVLARYASATAVAVADVLLLQDNIDGVPFVIAKAHQTTNLVKQSVGLALTCIIIAALPSVMGFLPLWLTVLLHEGGTLVVCLNSVRAFNDPRDSWSWQRNMKKLTDALTTIGNLFHGSNPIPNVQSTGTVS
eukprot:c14080_g1_i1 orf=219-2813(-)